jgi:hypothetical protein
MSVHFLPNSLAKWDGAEGEALVLTLFADERPLRGAAGLADWRMCGRLSRLIKQGKLAGRRGETLMLPPGRRLPFPRVILFGLGTPRSWSEDVYCQHVRWIRDVLDRAGCRSYALQPPGRATGLIAARRALELWLGEEHKDARQTEVAIIDAPSAQKEMAEELRGLRRDQGPGAGAGNRPGSDGQPGSALPLEPAAGSVGRPASDSGAAARAREPGASDSPDPAGAGERAGAGGALASGPAVSTDDGRAGERGGAGGAPASGRAVSTDDGWSEDDDD